MEIIWEEFLSITEAWERNGTPLTVTGEFPALSLSGTVTVCNAEGGIVELCGDKLIFRFRSDDRELRLFRFADSKGVVIDSKGDRCMRLTLIPLVP